MKIKINFFIFYFNLFRVPQWIKNFFIFFPLIFAQKLFDPLALKHSILAFFSFCFISSSCYIINDILDRRQDQLHPLKKERPIAKGEISLPHALAFSFLLLILGIFLASPLNQNFYLVLIAYIFLQIFYTLFFKNLVIIDAISIAIGFILRVLGGGVSTSIPISSWLYLCTFFLSLFLAFCKRRSEMEIENYIAHRTVLEFYSKQFLENLINISAGITVLCYALYIISPETIQKFHSPYLILTLPFVVYGIYRYLFLVLIKNLGGEPHKVIFKDSPFLVNIIFWLLIVFIIIYYEKL